ncbi:MAG: hypothetical protein LUF25_00765 [Phascolarctobacterium sp.]|nr:hypothetical protein [Phascolarctobacterium sp.]
MCQNPDWTAGDVYLCENAPELVLIIKKFSPCPLLPKKQEKYFSILLAGIVAQQLPPEVSQDLMQNIVNFLGNPITPKAVLAAEEGDLCALGLVKQKVDYVKNFASAVEDGTITMDKFSEMTNSQISKQLLQIRGLGQWTIEMFLLLALCRTDVVPSADFIFKKELQRLMRLPDIPKRGQIAKITEHWRPWRSLAVWYLWQNAGRKK